MKKFQLIHTNAYLKSGLTGNIFRTTADKKRKRIFKSLPTYIAFLHLLKIFKNSMKWYFSDKVAYFTGYTGKKYMQTGKPCLSEKWIFTLFLNQRNIFAYVFAKKKMHFGTYASRKNFKHQKVLLSLLQTRKEFYWGFMQRLYKRIITPKKAMLHNFQANKWFLIY